MSTNILKDAGVRSFLSEPIPEGKTKHSKADGGGLFLIKQSTKEGHTASWFLKFQWRGKRKEMSLGQYPVVSLATARELAIEAKGLLNNGINPIEQRVEERVKHQTFGELADEYLRLNKNEWADKTAWQWDTDLNKKYASIRNKSLPDVSVHDLARILKPIWLTRIESANRLHRRIRAVLDEAVVDGVIEKNPADLNGPLRRLLPKRGNLVAVKRHHPSLPYEEVPAFLEALEQRQGIGAKAVELVILTALRSNELRGGQWSEVDIDRKIWTIPAERMKERKEHKVPLSYRAVEALTRLRVKNRGQYIFPGEGASGYISEAGLRNLLKKLPGGDRASIHGFRSTFRTWAAERTSFPREMCEMALAHKVGSDVERAYQRSDLLERRFELMNVWADYCSGQHQEVVCGGENVVAVSFK